MRSWRATRLALGALVVVASLAMEPAWAQDDSDSSDAGSANGQQSALASDNGRDFLDGPEVDYVTDLQLAFVSQPIPYDASTTAAQFMTIAENALDADLWFIEDDDIEWRREAVAANVAAQREEEEQASARRDLAFDATQATQHDLDVANAERAAMEEQVERFAIEMFVLSGEGLADRLGSELIAARNTQPIRDAAAAIEARVIAADQAIADAAERHKIRQTVLGLRESELADKRLNRRRAIDLSEDLEQLIEDRDAAIQARTDFVLGADRPETELVRIVSVVVRRPIITPGTGAEGGGSGDVPAAGDGDAPPEILADAGDVGSGDSGGLPLPPDRQGPVAERRLPVETPIVGIDGWDDPSIPDYEPALSPLGPAVPAQGSGDEAEDPADSEIPVVEQIVEISPPMIVNAEIADEVARLIGDAQSDGVELRGWGYRPRELQIEVRLNNCGTSGYAIFDRRAGLCNPPSARPGASQHELGLAIDFTENGTILNASSPGFFWMRANAANYGLINLPSEPWHWSTTGR